MPTRRALLRAAALTVALAGCRRTASPPRPARADSDAALLRAARADERRLLAAYDATLARHPALRAALAPVRAQHAAHLAALGSAPAGPAASAPPGRGAVPRTALAALRAAERAAARARGADAVRASRARAPLFASIGGSEAAHAELLAGLLR